ncbi:sigma-54-dependent Fis family transcriptional regulator [Rhodoferax lacus]|uniref:Sigma-54-dependent Fis family transcriptional regulator n=1 Tax=Rhodoferax lacus TaxID=2184758 RepID=A0A3E1R7I2_9BURK|nr:sigma-54 dependent transcriptional regulator [Rhodoferax lacus]RFO94680.1 sigma-54-dependent Fis family transcriptional regulator [Rhodoferax lacus]
MPPKSVLVVSLEIAEVEMPTEWLPSGWKVLRVMDVCSAREVLTDNTFTVGLLLLGSVTPRDVEAIDDLLEWRQSIPWVGVLSPLALRDEGCRRLIVKHFFEFHMSPVDGPLLAQSLERAERYAEKGEAGSLKNSPSKCAGDLGDMSIIGDSPVIRELRRQIVKVATVNVPVLIWGESGSGKELVAHAIHKNSPRAEKPFVAMNCGAVPASLIQAELFGYERGAFTGALKDKKGLIESAEGGTLFLDEIGDLALELQVNLLRFLQERTIVRVGSSHPLDVDVRVIAASHMQLEEAVRLGRFREDLLYRLNVLPITVPTLRDRKEDIDLLAHYFFKRFSAEKGRRLDDFGSRAMLAMYQHDWPGNVRELINRIRRAMVMSEGHLITPEDLGLHCASEFGPRDALGDARFRAECEAIHDSLAGNGNNKTRAARDLGVSRMTLYRLMGKHGISA